MSFGNWIKVMKDGTLVPYQAMQKGNNIVEPYFVAATRFEGCRSDVTLATDKLAFSIKPKIDCLVRTFVLEDGRIASNIIIHERKLDGCFPYLINLLRPTVYNAQEVLRAIKEAKFDFSFLQILKYKGKI